MLSAACWAPSGGNIQSWNFIVLEDRTIREMVRKISPGYFGELLWRARYEKFLLTSDVNGFRRAADELVERFAKELKRRYSETRDRQQAAQH